MGILTRDTVNALHATVEQGLTNQATEAERAAAWSAASQLASALRVRVSVEALGRDGSA